MFTKTDIENYFSGEKTQATIIFFIGLAVVIFAIAALLFLKTQGWSGIAMAAGIIAIIQLCIGGIVYKRADKQRTDMVYNYDMNPQKIITEEIPRMQKVNTRFTLIRLMEIAGIAGGVFLIYYFRSNVSKQFWVGAGIAIIIQSAVMFAMDSIAANRAKVYTEKMISFYQKNK